VLGWVTVFGRVHTTSVCNKPTRSTQPCIPLGSLNRVPALTGWGKGGNVTSAGWQIILCDPIWHVSSRSGEACGELLYPVTYLIYLLLEHRVSVLCKVNITEMNLRLNTTNPLDLAAICAAVPPPISSPTSTSATTTTTNAAGVLPSSTTVRRRSTSSGVSLTTGGRLPATQPRSQQVSIVRLCVYVDCRYRARQ